MKIIATDNFCRDDVSDVLVAENIKSEDMAKTMCDALNEKYSGDAAPKFFRVVPDDHKLYEFEV